MSIRAIYFEEKNIGEHIKKSKKQFIWKFELDGLQHTIEFLVSKLTGKKKILQDGISLYEQKKMTTSFQFPFNIGKHMWVIAYSSKEVDLRIDNNTFESLYKGRKFDHNVPSVYTNNTAPARSNTNYIPQDFTKKVPEGWADIKKAKDGLNYDDIPDPYSTSSKTEIRKEQEPESKAMSKEFFESMTRDKKSHTIFKKQENTDFFGDKDEFDWGTQKQTAAKPSHDAFAFEFDQPIQKKSESDPFSFDEFSNKLPTNNKKDIDPFGDFGGSKADPFAAMGKSKSTGLEDVFGSKPQKHDDIFGGGILAPETNKISSSSNPFDAFNIPEKQAPPPKQNPFVSDVFSNNSSFPSAFGGSSSATFGSTGDSWGAAFPSAFPSTFPTAFPTSFQSSNTSAFPSSFPSAFPSSIPSASDPFADAFGPKPVAKPSTDFAHLNPLSSGESSMSKPVASKPSGGALPPGVGGFDLFQ